MIGLILTAIGTIATIIATLAAIYPNFFVNLFTKTPGSLVSDKVKAAFPKTRYNVSRTLSSLDDMTVILAIASASDYSKIANTLRGQEIISSMSPGSITVLGIYGAKELLFEVICRADIRLSVFDMIKNKLEPNALTEISIKSVAKLNNCEISRFSLEDVIIGVELEDEKLKSAIGNINYETLEIPKKPVYNNDYLEVPNMPIIISYVFIEPKDKFSTGNNIPSVLSSVYNEFRALAKKPRVANEFYSLFLAENAVIIKSIYPLEYYYAFMRFTKRIEQVIRISKKTDILRVTTLMGAEIIQFM